jgi:hypothetical protein
MVPGQFKGKKFTRPCLNRENARHSDVHLSSQLLQEVYIGKSQFGLSWAKSETLSPK